MRVISCLAHCNPIILPALQMRNVSLGEVVAHRQTHRQSGADPGLRAEFLQFYSWCCGPRLACCLARPRTSCGSSPSLGLCRRKNTVSPSLGGWEGCPLLAHSRLLFPTVCTGPRPQAPPRHSSPALAVLLLNMRSEPSLIYREEGSW